MNNDFENRFDRTSDEPIKSFQKSDIPSFNNVFDENPYSNMSDTPSEEETNSVIFNSDKADVDEPVQSLEQDTCAYEWYADTLTKRTEILQGTQEPPKKRESRGCASLALFMVLCIFLSSVFGGGSAFFVSKYLNESGAADSIPDSNEDSDRESNISGITENNSDSTQNTVTVTGDELTTVEIVDLVADSVVEITTETVQTGNFAQQYIESGAGSGVIIDSRGLIVTNNHVIEGAGKITVTLRAGESYSATVVGTDAKTDLALIEIEADVLTAAAIGNSDDLKIGERTVAIGNPLGQLGGTVTEGILSALDRDVVVDGQTMSLLQTDTAINPGNSGGGLFDSCGMLIGIVSAKSSGSEVEGLGFAIPVNDMIEVVSDLIEYGYVRGRVYLGMDFIDVNSIQSAWMYGLSELGCYIYSVDRGSNAAEAGFKNGDLVIAVNSIAVSSSDDIDSIINSLSVGDEVTFTLKRSDRTGDITMLLEEYVP